MKEGHLQMTMPRGAVAHAAAVRASYDLQQLEWAAICSGCDHESEKQVVCCGHLLARSETEHWRRLLASANDTRADPAFYLAQLNRYTADGERAPIGNLANAERREGGSWRLECQPAFRV